MKKLIVCTGRPASGKTTLLKELARQQDTYCRHRYIDLDGKDSVRLDYYEYITYCVDKLFMETEELYKFLKEAVNKKVDNITVYKFEDDPEQCLINNSQRDATRSARHTIEHKRYEINEEALVSAFTAYPTPTPLSLQFVTLPVYKKSEWEQYFEDHNVTLSYKTVAYNYEGEIWDINPRRVNKRYIVSDYWATDKKTKHYNSNWDVTWRSESDDAPVEFKDLEDLLSTIPNLNYSAARDLKLNLVKTISYEVEDYYDSATHTYYCIDAEALYNSLKLINQ